MAAWQFDLREPGNLDQFRIPGATFKTLPALICCRRREQRPPGPFWERELIQPPALFREKPGHIWTEYKDSHKIRDPNTSFSRIIRRTDFYSAATKQQVQSSGISRLLCQQAPSELPSCHQKTLGARALTHSIGWLGQTWATKTGANFRSEAQFRRKELDT